jgi:hypothetical protein
LFQRDSVRTCQYYGARAALTADGLTRIPSDSAAHPRVAQLLHDRAVNATQLEALVLQAVERVQGRGAVEDDRVEFKREWPGPEKVRQLAAAANRAGGDWLIYVIGVDEADGSIHPSGGVDPATWWPQFEASFDEVSPELVRHLNVRVSETDSVVALLFRTDRTPYVVKVVNGGATEREVPIRVGTRTRSAHRHELLRLLLPAASVPVIGSLGAYLELGRPGYSGDDSDSITQMRLRCQIFFEHLGPQSVFLPNHLARVTLISAGIEETSPIYYSRSDRTATATFGVSLRWDGIELSGPGSAHVDGTWKFPIGRHDELAAQEEWRLRLEFGVAGTDKTAVVEVQVANKSSQEDTSLSSSPDSPTMRHSWNDRGIAESQG